MRGRVQAVAVAALLTACGGGTAASPATTPLSSPTATASPEPTSVSSAAPSDEERVYPYALQWPAEHLNGKWQFARTAWDGEARIDSGNPYTDIVLTSEGRLFAFGLPTDDSAEQLDDLFAANAEEWHGCDREPVAEEALAGGGADGIYGEYQCGSTTVLRWAGQHDGFGLLVAHILRSEAELDEASARFKEQISELQWTD